MGSQLLPLCQRFVVALAVSLIKNASAYCGYLFGFRRDAYIFSKLNDRSLTLTLSVYNEYRDKRLSPPLIVFMEVITNSATEALRLFTKASP